MSSIKIHRPPLTAYAIIRDTPKLAFALASQTNSHLCQGTWLPFKLARDLCAYIRAEQQLRVRLVSEVNGYQVYRDRGVRENKKIGISA